MYPRVAASSGCELVSDCDFVQLGHIQLHKDDSQDAYPAIVFREDPHPFVPKPRTDDCCRKRVYVCMSWCRHFWAQQLRSLETVDEVWEQVNGTRFDASFPVPYFA